ncbi:MAG: phosphate-starvation-inducible PsiE family protein [Nitrospirae bacterium]|nr:phosphate-starvation-inducible PsiE family protein [Nitrospirota bacterium]
MRSFREIKLHYNFSVEDEKRLVSLKDVMAGNADRAMDALHSWILQTKQTAAFFTEESRKKHIFEAQKIWFMDLFGGNYDNRYYERLIRIGQVHMKTLVDAHFMNRSVNIIRNFCINILNSQVDDAEDRARLLISIEKILDINLDVITSSYIEEELRAYSPAYRVRNALISFSERFSQTMNLVLVLALIGLTLGVIGLFVYDLVNLVSGNLEHGIITALGSMLILWVMIELMNTEIAHLKGGKFHISVFIGVALVAFIREALIMTLKHEKVETQYYLIALILILGIVFWLVTKAEERSK